MADIKSVLAIIDTLLMHVNVRMFSGRWKRGIVREVSRIMTLVTMTMFMIKRMRMEILEQCIGRRLRMESLGSPGGWAERRLPRREVMCEQGYPVRAVSIPRTAIRRSTRVKPPQLRNPLKMNPNRNFGKSCP